MTASATSDAFFRTAARGQKPHAYQRRRACGLAADPTNPATLTSGTPCASLLINMPTGLGKIGS